MEAFRYKKNLLVKIQKFRLKKLKLKTRNAIRILEMYNYPKEVIIDARKIEKFNFES